MTDFQDGQTDVLNRLSKVCGGEVKRGFFRNRAIEHVLEEIIVIGNEIIKEMERELRAAK